MAGQPSLSSSLPWAWIIEALASFKEVGIATLIDVFKRSPEVSSDFGNNAREIASFRILERLFDPDSGSIKSVFSASNCGVHFDFSERCEDVLQRILGEMRVPTIWDESEISKWDIQPFIAHKRSCLFKCNLQLLKDSLVEGRLSHLPFLKQSVTSLHQNHSGTRNLDGNSAIFNNQQQNVCIDDSDSESEPSSDDDCFHKEINNISAKKHAFFRSKCPNRDMTTHVNKENYCMKCKNGGQLLVCSSNACPFAFHYNCLVSTSSLNSDLTGNFYCPFCIYYQAISDYQVVKKKASLARNDLGSFKKSPSEISCVSEKNEMSNKRERNNVFRIVNNTEDVERALPLRMYVMVENDNIVSNLGVSDLRSESLENSEEAKIIDRSMGLRKQIKPCTYLDVPQRRRVPVPWTQLEEETLKKLVEKLSGANSIHNRGFPWRKILDLGASVFQKSRKPGDLKDKWRNMQKASTNST